MRKQLWYNSDIWWNEIKICEIESIFNYGTLLEVGIKIVDTSLSDVNLLRMQIVKTAQTSA